jgi:hypothetical protein
MISLRISIFTPQGWLDFDSIILEVPDDAPPKYTPQHQVHLAARKYAQQLEALSLLDWRIEQDPPRITPRMDGSVEVEPLVLDLASYRSFND